MVKPGNGAIATALLPDVFNALLFGDLKQLVNAGCRVLLHPRQEMAVQP
jgi:hypothetical protein